MSVLVFDYHLTDSDMKAFCRKMDEWGFGAAPAPPTSAKSVPPPSCAPSSVPESDMLNDMSIPNLL